MPRPNAKRMTTERIRIQSPRMRALINGDIDVDELDDEELARGYPRAEDGTFRGRPPRIIPRELHDRMVARLLERGDALFREEFQTAIRTMAGIAQDPGARDADRIKAAQFIIERVAGKTPEKFEFKAADPWQQIIEDILIDPDPSVRDMR